MVEASLVFKPSAMLPPCQCPQDHVLDLTTFKNRIRECNDAPNVFRICPCSSLGAQGLRTACALWIPSNNRPGYSLTFSRHVHNESETNQPLPDFGYTQWVEVPCRERAWDAVKTHIWRGVYARGQ